MTNDEMLAKLLGNMTIKPTARKQTEATKMKVDPSRRSTRQTKKPKRFIPGVRKQTVRKPTARKQTVRKQTVRKPTARKLTVPKRNVKDLVAILKGIRAKGGKLSFKQDKVIAKNNTKQATNLSNIFGKLSF